MTISDYPTQRVLDLIIDALDSGAISYWLRGPVVVNLPEGFEPDALSWLEASAKPWTCRRCYFAPLVAGGSLVLPVEDGTDAVLDIGAVTRGLQVMESKAPRHFADWLSENEDAITADVFFQCCAFGELVYG